VNPSLIVDEYERRFRSAFANAAIGMIIVDDSGMVTYANEAWRRIAGYEESELVGMHYSLTVHPDDRALSLEAFRRIMDGDNDGYTKERRLIRKDGGLVWRG
jgi:PAS domain S-box-containing protein